MFLVKARYYADSDQFGESYVLTSDNGDKDLRIEVGRNVRIVPLCPCGKDAVKKGMCEKCYNDAVMY